MGSAKFNIYQYVTETILTELQAGTLPWRQPWSGGAGLTVPLRSTGERYRGINVFMLQIAAIKHGYNGRYWMTYKQSQDLGGQVRKGEKSTTVVKFGTFRKNGDTDSVSGVDREETIRWYARAYCVFNSCQIDGLDAHWYDQPVAPKDLGTQGDPALDAWFASLGIPIRHSAEPQAYYHTVQDFIHMPNVKTFESMESYFDTLAHESAHAVASSKRLDLRFEGATPRARYSLEEIFAEMTGSYVCARLGIQPDISQNAAYIRHWMDVLAESNHAVFRIAARAQAAADWMFQRAGDLSADMPEPVAA